MTRNVNPNYIFTTEYYDLVCEKFRSSLERYSGAPMLHTNMDVIMKVN